jgi:hypothetical protein
MQLRVSESPPAAAVQPPPMTRAAAAMEISPEPLATPRELAVSPARITQAHLSTRRGRRLLDSYDELGYQCGGGSTRLQRAIEAVQPIYQLVQNNSEGDMDNPDEACWQPLRCKQKPWSSWQLNLRHRSLACAKNKAILDELQDALYEQLPQAFLRKRPGQRPVCQMLLLLRTEPGYGGQEGHCDIEVIVDGELSCSLATFLGPTLSTAFTSMALKDTQRLYGGEMSDAERWAMTASSNFSTVRMTPGMTQAWGGSTLHRQPTNTTGHMRVMAYSLWTFVPRPSLGAKAFYPRMHLARPSDRATAIAARVMMQVAESDGSEDETDDLFVLEQQPPSTDEEISDDESPSTPPCSPRKSFSDLKRGQRRKSGAAVLAEVSDVLHSHRMTPAELAAMLTVPVPAVDMLASRMAFSPQRKLRSILRRHGSPQVLPSDYAERQLRDQLEAAYLQLESFTHLNGVTCNGAYDRDPLHLIHDLCHQWQRATILVDCGGGTVKIGIALHVLAERQWQTILVPLLIYEGKDNNDGLSPFSHLPKTPFIGESSRFMNIWALLQHLVDGERVVFLCGDLKSIAAVRGQLNPPCNYPCPICSWYQHDSAGSMAKPRWADQPPYVAGRDPSRTQLLRIAPDRIVPPALHLLLGLGNDMLKQMAQLCPAIAAARKADKDASDPAGASEVHQLNGNQLKRFVEKRLPPIIAELDKQAAVTRHHGQRGHIPLVKQMAEWSQQLVELMLPASVFGQEQLAKLDSLIASITTRWTDVSALESRPKLHVLAHCSMFVKQWGALAAFGETPIERYHATFNSAIRYCGNERHRAKRMRLAMRNTLIPVLAQHEASKAAPPPAPVRPP